MESWKDQQALSSQLALVLQEKKKKTGKSKTSPSSQGSISICLCCPSKAQPHDVTREAKIMGETALFILASAYDYLQLQVAQNYLWSLKRLTFYFIPRTNSFLETFLRDKGTKNQKVLDISATGKEKPVGKHDFHFFNIPGISPLLYP